MFYAGIFASFETLILFSMLLLQLMLEPGAVVLPFPVIFLPLMELFLICVFEKVLHDSVCILLIFGCICMLMFMIFNVHVKKQHQIFCKGVNDLC